jgi:hypothetical protein
MLKDFKCRGSIQMVREKGEVDVEISEVSLGEGFN